MKKVFILLSLLALPIFPALEDGAGLIGIPTANVIGSGGELRLLTSFATRGGVSHPFAFSTIVGWGFNDRMETYLKAYTSRDFAIDFEYLILKGKGNKPSFAAGIRNITYRKYISPVGGNATAAFPDDSDYVKVGGRPPEFGSIFGVMSIKPHPMVELTFGLGRGEFVGYGPRSHWFNTDILFATNQHDLSGNSHPWFTLGLFMGGKVELAKGTFLMADFDGRDAHIGIRYDSPMFQANVSWSKVEQIIGSYPMRVDVGLALKSPLFFPYQMQGFITGIITDKETHQPTSAKIIVISSKTKERKVFTTTGVYKIALTPGRYTIYYEKSGFNTLKANLTLRASKSLKLNIPLTKKKNKAEVAAEAHIKTGVLYYKGNDYISAKKEFQTALRLDPMNILAKGYLTKVNKKIREQVNSLTLQASSIESTKPATALSIWKKVLEYDPNNALAKLKVTEITKKLYPIMRKKRPAVRRKKPARRVKRKPVKKLTKAEINRLYKQAVGYYMDGKYKKAIGLLKKILKSDPTNARAKRYLEKAQKKL